ncbi:glutathione S-transferase family protein [Pigmentiphaga sp. YJ18]|uniref:glutathione S-transferase family protein n=1 Tax=Pigmentiphaga sp. YJ18 TaxID=3134907 RepID=UPI0031166EA0
MLELYHAINSVCAQKVRLALAEKGLQAQDHMLKLNGDQYDPAYLKLNPNGVVPTLVHDGHVVLESTVMLYYLDDVFPQPALMPADPLGKVKVHLINKLVDEYVHNACIVLTFAIAFRPALLSKPPEEREASFGRSPIRNRAEYKRDVVQHGLASAFVTGAVQDMVKLVTAIDKSLDGGSYIAGEAWSNAEAAVIPYMLRLELLGLSGLWESLPAVSRWWTRVRARASTQEAIFQRMTEVNWAPFKSIHPDPWPQIQALAGGAA